MKKDPMSNASENTWQKLQLMLEYQFLTPSQIFMTVVEKSNLFRAYASALWRKAV